MEVSADVSLRDVVEADIEVFYGHQMDSEAVSMAAFPPRDAEAHAAHWAKVLANDTAVAQTIVMELA